jgi:ABC-type transport system substrate-binding protein
VRRAVSRWLCAGVTCAVSACDVQRSLPQSSAVQVAIAKRSRGIDPRYSLDISEGAVNGLVFESLAERDVHGEAVPWLARGWSSTDSVSWTFLLHAGVKFHDGTPFRAADVVRAWTALVADTLDGDQPPSVIMLVRGAPEVRAHRAREISGLVAVDDTTLRVELTRREPSLPRTLGSRRLGVTAAASRLWAPVGTGPWRYATGGAADTVLRFARNANYWAGVAAAESLVVRVVRGARVAEAFAAGLLDCANDISEPEVLMLASSRAVRLRAQSQDYRARVLLNFSHPALRNVTVRRALLLALDRGALANALKTSNVLATDGVVPRDLMRPDVGALVPYAPDSARRLLAAAGFGPAHPLQLRLPSTPALEPFEQIGPMLAEYWRAIGIEVANDGARGDDSPRTRPPSDAEIWLEQPGVRTVEEYLNTVVIEAPFGFTGPLEQWDNDLFREWYTTARSTRDSAVRDVARRSMAQMLKDSLPSLPLFFVGTTEAWSQRVSTCDETMPRYARAQIRK